MTLQEKADALLKDQLSSWPLLAANWEKLEKSQIRQFDFEGFTIRVQCNPKRIGSSAAKVDKVSIQKRPCFLCAGNRPPEEKEVWAGDDYEILCNPFPIFRAHYTIAKAEHTSQVIETEFGRFLQLSRELPDLALFYNAPNCGASAPDHMHFQAGNRGFMPIEEEISSLKDHYGKLLLEERGLKVTAVADGLRRFYVIESESIAQMEQFGAGVFRFLRKLQNGGEPMINMLSYYRDGWQVLLFPRGRHRPWQYFEEGEENIMLSPASVDMGGTLITPLEKDFQKIRREDVEDIFCQVTFPAEQFDQMNQLIIQKFETHEP